MLVDLIGRVLQEVASRPGGSGTWRRGSGSSFPVYGRDWGGGRGRWRCSGRREGLGLIDLCRIEGVFWLFLCFRSDSFARPAVYAYAFWRVRVVVTVVPFPRKLIAVLTSG